MKIKFMIGQLSSRKMEVFSMVTNLFRVPMRTGCGFRTPTVEITGQRIFFVANASGKKLKVQHVQRDGTLAGDQYVLINNGCSIDLDYYSVKIEDADGSQNPQVYFQNKVDPRVSIIVCPDGNVRYSKQLLGEDVEREKWRVDGKSYKPLDVKEFCSGICDTIRNGFARCKRFFLRVWSKIKNCSKSRVTCCSRN